MTIPDDATTTRAALHRVAVHVLARRRAAATGRFGLRPTPGGFGTPAFGGPEDEDGEEVLRIAGTTLVREVRRGDEAHTTLHPIGGASLDALATFAGADLTPPLSVGRDTPDLGDRDAPLAVSEAATETFAWWFHTGALALDRLLVERGPEAAPSIVQLWPEHFDLACDVVAGPSRVNLGVSPGDHYVDGPYAYVGPRTSERPGDPAFWNAPFGAALGYDDVVAGPDPVEVILAFFREGLELLTP